MTDKPTASDAALIERLLGPHEWGYRDITDGTFIEDGTPFEAAGRFSYLSATEGEMQVTLEEYRVALIELEDREGEMRKALATALTQWKMYAELEEDRDLWIEESVEGDMYRSCHAHLNATTPSPAGEREKALEEDDEPGGDVRG